MPPPFNLLTGPAADTKRLKITQEVDESEDHSQEIHEALAQISCFADHGLFLGNAGALLLSELNKTIAFMGTVLPDETQRPLISNGDETSSSCSVSVTIEDEGKQQKEVVTRILEGEFPEQRENWSSSGDEDVDGAAADSEGAHAAPKRRRWSDYEMKQFLRLLTKYGPCNWSQMTKEGLLHRDNVQLKDKYRNLVKRNRLGRNAAGVYFLWEHSRHHLDELVSGTDYLAT